MSKERQKGSIFEAQVASYLSKMLDDDRIERRATNGKNDRGDIAGVKLRGKRVVLECKNCRKMELSEWIEEAEIERGNDDAEYAFVVHKRKGYGDAKIGGTYVTCTLETLASILNGGRL